MSTRTALVIRTLHARACAGDAEAMFEVADRLRKGDGCERDEAEALSWYQRAAHAGHREAEFFVANWHLRPHFDFPDTAAGRDLSKPYLEHVTASGQRNAALGAGQQGQNKSSIKSEQDKKND